MFDYDNPRIPYLKSTTMPENMTEEKYLMVRRKVQAAFRHKIYMVMVGFKEDELKNRGKRAI